MDLLVITLSTLYSYFLPKNFSCMQFIISCLKVAAKFTAKATCIKWPQDDSTSRKMSGISVSCDMT